MAVSRTDILIGKRVFLPSPESLEFDQLFNPDRVLGENVTIHAGCRLFGEKTLICHGAELGLESPVTIKDCFIGPNVKLKGGYFENAVFLEGAEAGYGAHVRTGTILEEQASIAHTVGLKQTILFPFVTLGSLINFCDCMMTGGTSRQDHSEVGSSYIHFNYTPNQDKATPSIMGDVPRGVILNQSPIFLGGQGGMVGPCRLEYGTVVAAGTICRKDHLSGNQLVMDSGPRTASIPFKPWIYHGLKRIIKNNLNYIANLYALMQWYKVVRRQFVGERFPQALLDGLMVTLKMGIDERIKQLGRLIDNVQRTDSVLDPFENAFCVQWSEILQSLNELEQYSGSKKYLESCSEAIYGQIQSNGKNYLQCIKTLTADQAQIGTQWLQEIVDRIVTQIISRIKAEG